MQTWYLHQKTIIIYYAFPESLLIRKAHGIFLELYAVEQPCLRPVTREMENVGSVSRGTDQVLELLVVEGEGECGEEEVIVGGISSWSTNNFYCY